MALGRPKLELWADGPFVGDPDRVHSKYPGEAVPRPFPDFPPLATFYDPMHDSIVLPTIGAEGRAREPDGM
jgi:hypothetical protein